MNKSLYTRLLGYTFRYKGLFCLSIFGFFLFSAADISAVEWLKQVISYINENNENPLNPANLAIFLAFISIIRGIGFYVGNYFMANIGQKVVHNLREDLISSLLYQPISFFDQDSKGEIVNRIIFTTNQITGAATDALKIFFKEGFLLVGLFIYLLYLSWKLTLVILIIAPLIGLIVSIAGKRLRRVAKKIQDVMGVVTQVSNEIASGAREIKSFNNESGEKERFQQANDENLKQNLKMESTGNIATPLIQVFVAIALAAMSYLALTNLDELNLPSESFVAFFTAAGLMARPIRQLSNLNGIIQRGLAAAEDIFKAIDNSPEKYNEGLDLNKTLDGEVQIDNVSFSYSHDSEPVLNNISIKASKGETVALVGKSGSGKSTLIRCVNFLEKFQEGNIVVAGIELTDDAQKIRKIRSEVAMVFQHFNLFPHLTIVDNLTLAPIWVHNETKEEAREKALKFLERVDISEQAEKYPNQLSGGQQQRVAIARSLCTSPKIMLFDEPTSALDPEMISEVLDVMVGLAKEGITMICVTHEMGFAKKMANRIIFMDEGQIVEENDPINFFKNPESNRLQLFLSQILTHDE